MRFTTDFSVRISHFGFILGVLSAMCGIGGGSIIAPLLLNLEFDPREQSYTSTFIVFYLSAASISQFVFYDNIDINYALVGIACSVIGMLIGNFAFLRYFKSKRKNSYIAIVLCISIFIGVIFILVAGVTEVSYHTSKNLAIWSFKSFC